MGNEKTRFKPGNPGGPGRPKQKPFIDWCKDWTYEKAEAYLRPIAEDPKHKQQMEAIKLIMAYAVGKPPERSEVTLVNDNPFANLDDATLDVIEKAYKEESDEPRGTESTPVGTEPEKNGGEAPILQTEPSPAKVD